MQVTLSDGRLVEIVVGSKLVLKPGITSSQGPFVVTGFDGDLPVVEIEGQSGAWSIETIADVIPLPVSLVPVEFTPGVPTLVPSNWAPAFEALISSNVNLLQQISNMVSGGAAEALQTQLDAANAAKAAAEAKIAALVAKASQVAAARTLLADIEDWIEE